MSKDTFVNVLSCEPQLKILLLEKTQLLALVTRSLLSTGNEFEAERFGCLALFIAPFFSVFFSFSFFGSL